MSATGPSPLAYAAVRAEIVDVDRLAAAARKETPPWPVVLLLFFGAQLATVPFLAFLAAAFGDFFMDGPGGWVLGPIFLSLGVFFLRKDLPVLFLEHLAFVALQTGLLLIAVASVDDLDTIAGFTLTGGLSLVCGLLARPKWVAFVSGITAILMLGAALHAGDGIQPWPPQLALTAGLFAIVVAVVWIGVDRSKWIGPKAELLSRIDALATGCGVGTLALSVILQEMDRDGSSAAGSTSLLRPIPGIALPGLLLTAASAAWLALRSPELRTPAFWGLSAAAGLLALFVPGFGPVAALAAVALGTGRSRSALLALLVACWLTGRFYYDLSLPLLEKSLLMAGAGAVLVAVWLIARRKDADETAPVPGARDGLARWLVVGGLAAVLGLANIGIRGHERTLSEGTKVYVELAPVDPRSLMQGDYMALRFKMEIEIPEELHRKAWAQRPRVRLDLDERRVATVRSLHAGESVPEGSLAVELTRRHSGWTFVTDAFHFREGTAATYEQARYGEFRITPQGTALLVGLADADLRPLRPTP